MAYNPANPNGQATSANSAPVVIASDQSAVPVTSSSLPLPTGAASAANQTNGTQITQVEDASGKALQVAQGSATSDQTGPLAQAATTSTAPTYVSGDTNPLSTDVSGNLRTLDSNSSSIASNTSAIAGAIHATASTAPTNAVESGSIAATALPTAVSNGQLVGNLGDKFGRQVVITQGMRDVQGQQATTITSSTAATTVVSAIASTYVDIESITFVNSSATATLVTLSDGTNSYYFYAPGGDMRGASYQVPLPATAVNTTWTVTCGTSVASLYVTVQYVKNK